MCAPFSGRDPVEGSSNEQRAVRHGQLGERQHLISSEFDRLVVVGHGVRGAIAVVLEGPRGIDRDGTGAVAERDQIVPDSDAPPSAVRAALCLRDLGLADAAPGTRARPMAWPPRPCARGFIHRPEHA